MQAIRVWSRKYLNSMLGLGCWKMKTSFILGKLAWEDTFSCSQGSQGNKEGRKYNFVVLLVGLPSNTTIASFEVNLATGLSPQDAVKEYSGEQNYILPALNAVEMHLLKS